MSNCFHAYIIVPRTILVSSTFTLFVMNVLTPRWALFEQTYSIGAVTKPRRFVDLNAVQKEKIFLSILCPNSQSTPVGSLTMRHVSNRLIPHSLISQDESPKILEKFFKPTSFVQFENKIEDLKEIDKSNVWLACNDREERTGKSRLVEKVVCDGCLQWFHI